LRLSVIFRVVLFLQTSSVLLHPCLKCVHSAASVAKVGPLETVSGLRITQAAWRYFTVWLAERLVAGLFGIAFHLPTLPLCILIVGGCYSLAGLQSSRLILFASCFFIPLFVFQYYNNYFTLVYFDWLPLNVFQCDWCPC